MLAYETKLGKAVALREEEYRGQYPTLHLQIPSITAPGLSGILSAHTSVAGQTCSIPNSSKDVNELAKVKSSSSLMLHSPRRRG